MTLAPRQRAALVAYARAGDRRQAASDLGLCKTTFNGYLAEAFRLLDVTSAIDAFRALGWLQVPGRRAPVADDNELLAGYPTLSTVDLGPIAREDVEDFYGGVAPPGRPVLW